MTFNLTKIDSKTKSPISGIQFELYDSTNNLLGKGTTDTNGKLLFKTPEGKTLYLTEGSYKLKEVNIPAGYSNCTSVTDFIIEKGDIEYHNNGLISCNVCRVAGYNKFDIDMTDLLNNEYLIEDNIITFISDGKDGFIPQGSSIESFHQYTNPYDGHSGTLYYEITFSGDLTADIKCIPIKDENGDKMTGKYVVANCSSSDPEIDVIYHIDDFVVENIPLEPPQMGLAVEASGISKLNSFDNKPIKNVQFELYSNADVLLGMGTSDENGKVTFTLDEKPVLLSEGSYKIKEIGTPTGYINTNPITEFTVKKGTPLSYNDGVVTVETYEIKDGNKLGVDNIFDLVNNEYLVGDDTVTFQIEENGLTPKFSGKASNVKSSTDDDGIITQTIVFTEDDSQYTMTYYPIKGKDGQVITGNYAVLCTNEDGTAIQVNAKCGVRDVVIYNEPEDISTTMGLIINGFSITKMDSSTNKPLEGITFEIQDNDNNVAASGTTDAEGKIAFLQSLAEGTYAINETNTPDGYVARDPLTFTVKKNIQTYNNGKVTCEVFEVEDGTSSNVDVLDITQNEYLL